MVIKCRCKFMSLGSFSNGMPRKTSFERKSIFPVVTILHFIIILFCLNSTMLAKCFTTEPRGAPLANRDNYTFFVVWLVQCRQNYKYGNSMLLFCTGRQGISRKCMPHVQQMREGCSSMLLCHHRLSYKIGSGSGIMNNE